MNESTEKIKRNFLSLSPEKQAEGLALLLELAEAATEREMSEHFTAVHDTLKNLIEPEARKR